jgi:hypothetical protein
MRSPVQALNRLLQWFASALQYSMGDLHEDQALRPPLIGVQPYSDRPSKLR